MGYQNQKVSSDRKGACLMGIDSLDRFLPILEREIAFHYILFAFQYTKPLWKMVILWRERNFPQVLYVHHNLFIALLPGSEAETVKQLCFVKRLWCIHVLFSIINKQKGSMQISRINQMHEPTV